MSNVKLTREGLRAALADFDTYGFGAADLGAGAVAVAAMHALLAATEPASDEEAVRDVLAIQIPDSVNEITAARNGYIAVSAYRAAEARVRRLAFGEEG